MTLEDVFSRLAKKVHALPEERLNALIDAMWKWFHYDEDDLMDATPDIVKSMPREEKASFIMGGDPIFEEGGLADFLHSEGIDP